jgi:murein DD-endopeptidase MepM/ murein hydrolase activator NlpD
MKLWLSIIAVFVISAIATIGIKLWPELARRADLDPPFQIPSPLELAALPTATRFDFPLGSENGALSYNAQPFTQNRHLGDDLNGIGGENSDLGDPVYAVADGRVSVAHEGGPGWGNVIIVLHAYRDREAGERKYVQSYYAHVEEMLVHSGDEVRRGQQIATVGTANGKYLAHLHFEMREFMTPFIGPGYRQETRGWLNPSAFIKAHRGATEDDVGRGPVP